MLRVPFEVVTDKFRPFYCSLLFIATFTIRWQHCLLSMYLVTDQCYLKYVAVGMPSNALLMNFFYVLKVSSFKISNYFRVLLSYACPYTLFLSY